MTKRLRERGRLVADRHSSASRKITTEKGAVHPVRAAQILDVPVKTITAMLKIQYLDNTQSGDTWPIHYPCPRAVGGFLHVCVTKKRVTGQTRDPSDPVVLPQLLEEDRIDLSKATEPIYRRELLSAF